MQSTITPPSSSPFARWGTGYSAYYSGLDDIVMLILEKEYHDELKMELQGIPYFASLSNKNMQSSVEVTETRQESVPDLDQVVEDAASMSKVVMSRKKRRFYEAMKVNCLHRDAQFPISEVDLFFLNRYLSNNLLRFLIFNSVLH